MGLMDRNPEVLKDARAYSGIPKGNWTKRYVRLMLEKVFPAEGSVTTSSGGCSAPSALPPRSAFEKPVEPPLQLLSESDPGQDDLSAGDSGAIDKD